ncbi:carotenoid synthesis regulator CarF [Sphingomonas sp. WG]|nr:fatty acid desaturase CarF family protein [Sphingomonas sp. ATCC 31555]KTF68399.1 carotenoid synthesis regulator CarF [Sphingomonas sp. WG]
MARRILMPLFLLSLAANVMAVLLNPSWWVIPALLAGWYVADLASGLVHMYMDYRPCPAGKGLDALYFYAGSRESDAYKALWRERMGKVGPLDRLVYDFKNHHPRPDALGRRDLWRLIGSTVILAALPFSLLLNAAAYSGVAPGWAAAAGVALIVGGAFAQYFHGALHRERNPWIVNALRRCRLLMTPAAHQLHHDTLQRDFATNCGWSNPLVNRLFLALRRRGMLDDAGLEPGA